MNYQDAIELLNILRSSIFMKEEHKYKGQKVIHISISVRGENNINKIKEWLKS